MNADDNPVDEEQIASILKAANIDTPSPDADALARLRAQSTEAFTAASVPPVTEHKKRRPARWLAAAAAVIAVGIGAYCWLLNSDSNLALGQALENVKSADTLHLRITRDGKQTEVWHTRTPDRWRWDLSDGDIRVQDGETVFIVDRRANSVTPGPKISGKNDLFAKFGLPGVFASLDSEDAILRAIPVGRTHDDGREILHYQLNLSNHHLLEAWVDARTQRLRRMCIHQNNQPIAEVTVLAYDEIIAADKFVITDTLTDDGRIGKVTDVQGLVSIKPVLHERWTPVRERVVLRPGDWVRTDARGANAAALRLVKETGVILGPHTLVELIGPKQIRLIEGEIEVAPVPGAPIELLGPGNDRMSVKSRQSYRINEQHLAFVEGESPWLRGFKGTTTKESLGSLVALVDGRNVPLSVGYHKVTVDIRDQIARTVVEESFVNHTREVLEGVFYFPLPQDASISGFGMWIGDNLVEADIVEKQRAREIYETIKREKRDPGLLEWTGGNIFKASVHPIPPHAEKRIKITYTQVLPLKGNRYRYSYALQSDMLRLHPLRELAIDVKLNSVIPLKTVTSPTHPTRNQQTLHSAHVEFSAQAYTPAKDFEVVVEVESRQGDVVMIPHRRGEDGYFMLQLTPPGGSGDWDRPLLGDGEPLDLLILADTSASIDAGQRDTQAKFIGALLASLTPKDKFNLAACDVTCDWAFDKARTCDAGNASAARDFLARRTSLGWTNLDVAVKSALERCGPKTQVIYVGDGIVTTGNADPVAFAKRLLRLPVPDGDGKPTFHAVALGSSYESTVLKAIAALGGGSVRKITSEQGPTVVARELLSEIASPAMRDVRVEFKGISAARVYPESLPNIPAGTQQILLGRYLPQGTDQSGEVIVTGTQAGKPVRFSSRVSLKDAESGNSFIPRLWARLHLDSLLDQGPGDAIKDEIISLSEEFHIITPYTSLLVLETDADRERFKVHRRFQMRDGQRFFTDGRDNAVFDLAQKQMKQAGAWRSTVRRSVLDELARLGRDPRLFQPRRSWKMAGMGGVFVSDGAVSDTEHQRAAGNFFLGFQGASAAQSQAHELEETTYPVGSLELPVDIVNLREPLGLEPGESRGVSPMLPAPAPQIAGEFRRQERGLDFVIDSTNSAVQFGDEVNLGEKLGLSLADNMFRSDRAEDRLRTLFPPLPAAMRPPKKSKSNWPAEASDLAKSVLRTEQLARMTGGIAIDRQKETFDARWGDLRSRSRRLELVSAKSWLARSSGDGDQTLVSWCDGKEVGIFSQAFQLGRIRASVPLDVQPPPLAMSDSSMTPLEEQYPNYSAAVKAQGKDRALLILTFAPQPIYETRILIDTDRGVILSSEDRYRGKVTSTTRYEDFVPAAGSWWAQRIETTDADGKLTSRITQPVTDLTLNQLEQRMQAELAGRARVQFLHLPLPSIAHAKKALGEGKASFDDQFALLLRFYRSQQWPRVFDHLQQIEKIAAGKPGLHWIRSALLDDSRRHEELRERNLKDAAGLAKREGSDAYFLAEHLVQESARIFQANEMLALLDVVKPVYDRRPPHVDARKHWQNLRRNYLERTGRTDEALALRKKLAQDYPRDYALQQEYAQALAGAGDYPAAYAWLTRVLVKEAKWTDSEENALRTTYAGFLEKEGRYARLAAYLAERVEQNPAGSSIYEEYLSALIKTDRIEKAEALALRWLKDAQVPGELPPPAAGRANAAIQLMLGQSHHLRTNRVADRWLTPLRQAALFFAWHEFHYDITGTILQGERSTQAEEVRKLRHTLADMLATNAEKMSAEQVRRFVDWVQREDAKPAVWNRIKATLRQRWKQEDNGEIKHTLGQALDHILTREDDPGASLDFLRLQWKTGPDKYRVQYANQLFDRLLTQPWTAAIEVELFTLFDKLSDADDAGARLFKSVAALHRLDDTLLANRLAAADKSLQHLEKLTRTDYLKKLADNRRQARAELSDRLSEEAAKHARPLARWLVAESLYLDLLLDRNLPRAATEAWEYLIAPRAKKKDEEEPAIERALEMVLQKRYVVMLMNLAARKGADPALVARLLQYIDKEAGADAPRWQRVKYSLLVALDRTKELEQTLGIWTRRDDPDNRWRIALGYLFGEQGKLADAIREFESVEASDELGPGEYKTLAAWYLVDNRREAYERAAAAVYQTMPEHRIEQALSSPTMSAAIGGRNRGTASLDPDVLRMFTVLFDKSARPQDYLGYLQEFYRSTHDFRLLAGLPDAVIGHTAERIYPFVAGMQPVLDEIRDEATADEIVKRIVLVRVRAKTAVDRRALDLLEAQVERRAAELQNQPGPHRDRALAALQRAFTHDWSAGEPRLLADYLAGLGKIAQPPLADEQLRQLKAVHAKTKPGSLDRLHIAYVLAQTLDRYKRADDASDLLQTALDEFQAANNGVLPTAANDVLTTYLGYLEAPGHFARGEKVLRAQLEHPENDQQRRWLNVRLDQLYHHALRNRGDVALGKGADLFQALHAKLEKDLAGADQNERYRLIELLCQVYRTGHEKKYASAVADLKTFAFQMVPPILTQQMNQHNSAVNTIAYTVHDLAGPTEGIVFLLDQIEREPRWLSYTNQDGWARFGQVLTEWRIQAKDRGAVDGRLLKLVLAELRRDLEQQAPRHQAIYHDSFKNELFWKEKKADFARTAEAVLTERSQSAAAVMYVADYFYDGLKEPGRAIEILFAADRQKVLDEQGQAKLAGFLQRQGRHGESIPILETLRALRPGSLDYRVQLMHAFFRTGRKADLLELLKQTDAFFHEKGRWDDDTLASLARSTLKNELFAQSVAYYKELIALVERTRIERGTVSHNLSDYYMGLARAYAGLQNTPEAVDAAGAAVVAWGRQRNQRAAALGTLKQVLLRSADLDAFVAHFDKQKQDSAIIRKAIGQAYIDKKEHARAIRQLELAAQLQPNDVEIYKLLVAAEDAAGDKAGAARQLLHAAQLARRDLKLYEDLGRRYLALAQPIEAERAYTSIVEMMPTESESHARLAEIREKQNRWREAIEQWQHAARLNALEPTPLLKLAAAQIHEKQWPGARATLHKLETATWPTRFSDVQAQTRKLAARVPMK